ncbi:23S rRNA (uracil(1939)-C(5))-methyltransferase RlmD [Barnesiella viscericola]|uniref:23S rRNA (Uracil(1939)-C(5))-methyltransferase RlmD n=1 Tax=Barnesiella viscericola TaxID=397865 RepID=A0A921MP60_9BACT|nr:23S rRNA (uracil(1939)-C(5))-methyltransferase RlmD [Barnesiella viscericola]HJG87850.1 23S rRNA (uracil(1939)-C(5))-methyltransferase RlmD [Barnesiella viscericola]
MARKKKELPLLEQIEITGVAAEGKALARVNDLVVFVPFAAPGDIVDLQVTRKKHSYAEARIVKFHTYSPLRVQPFCEHFGVCGGCKWQHVTYDFQLQFKRQQVEDNLTRIGKIPLPEVLPTKGSAKQRFYRNKLEYSFSNRSWLTYEQLQSAQEFDCRNALGFHIPGMFDKVLDIKKCWLQDDISNRIRLSIRQFAIDHGYPFFDLKEQTGLMRNMIVRTASTGEIMLIVVFFEPDMERIEAMMQHIADEFPQITSLLYIINQKHNDTITDQEVHLYRGRDYIWESMEGLRFKIGPKSFYQTNSEQAYELYKVAREFASLTGDELVYDLYTGTGTIANFVARQSRKVIGIEYVPEAIEDAKENARINGLDNTLFYAGDMKDILTEEFIGEHGRPDVIITDPPRAGMHDDVIKTILFAEPRRIVYVSCNPATQARDLSLLDVKYRVERVQPVDMFPHTHHVENVVLLVRKEEEPAEA